MDVTENYPAQDLIGRFLNRIILFQFLSACNVIYGYEPRGRADNCEKCPRADSHTHQWAKSVLISCAVRGRNTYKQKSISRCVLRGSHWLQAHQAQCGVKIQIQSTSPQRSTNLRRARARAPSKQLPLGVWSDVMLSQFPSSMIPLGRINKLLFSARNFRQSKTEKGSPRRRRRKRNALAAAFAFQLPINKKNQFQPQGNARIRWFLIYTPDPESTVRAT